ncbi:MAG: metalloregulator ArsR/SmtB family transcription factor [Planctomycetota bacterium]
MSQAPATQPDRLLRWMNCLADATRLRLLALLAEHELGVSDLCEVVQLPQSTVSRHLKILGDEGWAISRRQGTTNLYQVVLDELEERQRELWLITRDESSDWATLQQDKLRLQQLVLNKQQDADAFFADAAEQWESIRHDLYGNRFTTDAMLGLLPSDWTIADLGCGSGILSAELAPFVNQIIGVDNSEPMLIAAHQRNEDKDNIDLRKGELTALPIDDQSVNATLCVIVLSYIEDPAASIQEMARVLKPGGRAVIVDLLAHNRDPFRRQMGQVHSGFTTDRLTELFEQAGLSDIRCRPLPPAQDATGPALVIATASKPTD